MSLISYTNTTHVFAIFTNKIRLLIEDRNKGKTKYLRTNKNIRMFKHVHLFNLKQIQLHFPGKEKIPVTASYQHLDSLISKCNIRQVTLSFVYEMSMLCKFFLNNNITRY